MHEQRERELAQRIEDLRSEGGVQQHVVAELQAQRERERGIIDDLLKKGMQDYVSREQFEAMQQSLRDEHKRREEELWRELEATADVFMPKTKLQEMFNDHANQIEELRRLLAQQPEGPQKRVWDENLQTFVSTDPPSPTGSTMASRRGSMVAMANVRRGSTAALPPRPRAASTSAESSAVAAARAAAISRAANRKAAAPADGSLRRKAFQGNRSATATELTANSSGARNGNDRNGAEPNLEDGFGFGVDAGASRDLSPLARHTPLAVHHEASPTSGGGSPDRRQSSSNEPRTRFDLELDLASKKQQYTDTQADVARLETMQAQLEAQEAASKERIAAADRELERYRRQQGGHVQKPDGAAEHPTYMLPQGEFRRIASPNPEADTLASGEEWMAQPHVQRLLKIKEEERAKTAGLRRQVQTKVLELRDRQHDRPGDLSFDDKLAFFFTAQVPINERLQEEYESSRHGAAGANAHVAQAMNVKYDGTSC